jgi:hypothetical protein
MNGPNGVRYTLIRLEGKTLKEIYMSTWAKKALMGRRLFFFFKYIYIYIYIYIYVTTTVFNLINLGLFSFSFFFFS